jgi:hypothetical protein
MHRGSSWFSLVLPGNYPDSILNWPTVESFYILSNSFTTVPSFDALDVQPLFLTASLNKLQIKYSRPHVERMGEKRNVYM